MNDLVSVVVPVYNVEKFLDRCLKSIVEQTYKNLEIILVDDGSTDTCSSICDDWAKKDQRISVIHKLNQGLGYARNTGIEAATGRYILFVDSDDYIHSELTEKCVASLKETKADLVMFGRFNVDCDGNAVEKPIVSDRFFFEGDEVHTDILPGLFTYERGSGISSCCKMYDLDLIKKTQTLYKSERDVLSEDALFQLELFRHIKSVAIVPESFYYYYCNEKSLSRSYKKDLHRRNNCFLEKSIEVCEAAGYTEKVIDCIKARYHIYAFGGMKQINAMDFSKEEKRKELDIILKSRTLRNSISTSVLKTETFPLKLFFMCVRMRLFFVCRFLLRFAR